MEENQLEQSARGLILLKINCEERISDIYFSPSDSKELSESADFLHKNKYVVDLMRYNPDKNAFRAIVTPGGRNWAYPEKQLEHEAKGIFLLKLNCSERVMDFYDANRDSNEILFYAGHIHSKGYVFDKGAGKRVVTEAGRAWINS